MFTGESDSEVSAIAALLTSSLANLKNKNTKEKHNLRIIYLLGGGDCQAEARACE